MNLTKNVFINIKFRLINKTLYFKKVSEQYFLNEFRKFTGTESSDVKII